MVWCPAGRYVGIQLQMTRLSNWQNPPDLVVGSFVYISHFRLERSSKWLYIGYSSEAPSCMEYSCTTKPLSVCRACTGDKNPKPNVMTVS